ncbi:hypothetical protein ENSA5_24610 [Enhygromyxa salina]|uniref:Uncharacterized protein n=1 Tax=Enhygromyxa salina TaxID=215803 RepID=A0A2S9YB11_9BACT|nr:hypothetical protein [Enhygromyxa salina]PRQ02308.1 hypothetical protein ENSA5_24610 [Enhygromyxa salina]
MPSLVPPRRPDEVPVERLDVLGHGARGPLSHVGFASANADVSHGDEVPVADARPVRRNNDTMAVHAIGQLQLSRVERMRMATWLERRARSRTLSGDFVGPAKAQRDPISGRIIARSHSCAGLVHECLLCCAGVELVDLDALPPTSRERLVEIWGEKAVQVAGLRDELVGEGPWEVLLPAHILHALARADPRVGPLRPSQDQWNYPDPP